ncbi:hypothetical protein DD630_00985 [Streptomyces sp. BSE7F]|nr:hypothetical protein DD630_00985 [Streptomyces sp. BSE7F]
MAEPVVVVASDAAASEAAEPEPSGPGVAGPGVTEPPGSAPRVSTSRAPSRAAGSTRPRCGTATCARAVGRAERAAGPAVTRRASVLDGRRWIDSAAEDAEGASSATPATATVSVWTRDTVR